MPLFQSCFCVPKDNSHDDDDVSTSIQEAETPLDANVISHSGLHTPLFENEQFFFTHEDDHKKKSDIAHEKYSLLKNIFLPTLTFLAFAVGFYNLCTLVFDIVNMSRFLLQHSHDIVAPSSPIIVVIQLLLAFPFYFELRKCLMTINNTRIGHSNWDFDFETSSSIDTESETLSSDGSDTIATEPSYQLLGEGMKKKNSNNVGLREAFRNLPKPSTWKYRTIFIQPAGETRCPGLEPNQSVPLGVPVEFESNLFKGKIIFRFKGGETEDEQSHQAYFNSSQYKVQRQIMIQGQFKQRCKMSEMYMGDIFDKKWNFSPSPFVGRMVNKIFTRLAPGLLIDVASENPKVMVLIGSGSHAMSIDKPGDEPDMTAPDIPEKTFISNDLKSSDMRKKVLGNPDEASKYEFDPDMVYSFHSFDEVLDLAEYQFNLPFMSVDVVNALGAQPISIRAVNRPESSSESFFYFRCWHERTVKKLKEED